MDLRDFFKGARRRGPVTGDHATAAPSAPGAKVNATEENLFSASVGFAFKCGVCEKLHKSSLLEKVQSIKFCIKRIVKTFGEKGNVRRAKRYVQGYGNSEPTYGHGVKFLPNPDAAETVQFTFKAANAFSTVKPTSKAFTTLHPALSKRFDEFDQRLNDLLGREYVEDVSVKEALGAPNTMKYIRARQDAFKKRVEAEAERLRLEQEALDPEVYALARDWRSRKPERFKLGEVERGHGELKEWFQKRAPDSEPIRRLKLNGKPHDADTIMGWFKTLNAGPVWDAFRTGTVERVLFDVGLVNGFPAISWGMVGSREFPRKHHRREYKGLTVLNFVSLWNGKTFLNMAGRDGNFSLGSSLDRRSMVEIIPFEDSYMVEKSDLDATE